MTTDHPSAYPIPATDSRDPLAFDDPVFDAGTYTRLREPRSSARIPLGPGTWHQISRRWLAVQLITDALAIAGILAVAIAASALLRVYWVWLPAGILLAILVVSAAIVPRQARAIGWMLRPDDLVVRRGILWQRMVAVPYGRMQLVDVTQGPLDRGFGISQLKLVTAAASSGVTIPGLSSAAAERLRDILIQVAETRRTGL